jgi:hypothetical protein
MRREEAFLGSRSHVYGPRSLAAALEFERYFFSFGQSVKIEALESAAMEENLLTVFTPDKTKSAVPDKPLDCTFHD